MNDQQPISPLDDEQLAVIQGGRTTLALSAEEDQHREGQDGSELLIVNNGDGSDFLESRGQGGSDVIIGSVGLNG